MLNFIDQRLHGVAGRLRADMEAEHALQELSDDEREQARQERIADGEELACVICGCSETRACDGGCYWEAPGLCSRCV